MSRLYGRSAELTSAQAVLRSAARTGRGAVLVVTGETGNGRSALLAEITGRAAALGYVIGAARADSLAQVSPAAPLLLAVRSGRAPLLAGTDLVTLAGLVDQPLQLVEELADRLARRAAGSPVLIALDDLHHADRLTRFTVRALISRLARAPVVWALTTREPVSTVLADLALPGVPALPVTHLRLGPLTGSDLAAVAQDRLGRVPSAGVRALLAGIDGNPLLAVRIVDGVARARARREVDDGLPTEFVTGVRRSLAALDDTERELVELAAVLGRPFAPAEAAAVMSRFPPSVILERLEHTTWAGLLTHAAHDFAFRHELVRRTVYDDLGAATRETLHRRWAEHLLGTRGALAAAPHARVGARPNDERVVAVLRAAAEEAITVRPALAGDLILEAFHLTDPLRPELGRRAVALLTRLERPRDAQYVAQHLPVESATVFNVSDDLHALRAQGEAARRAGRHREALACFRRLSTRDPFAYLGDEVMALQIVDRYDDAESLLRSALRNAGDDPEQLLPSVRRARLWQNFNLSRFDAAEADARALVDVSRRRRLPVHEVQAHLVLSSVFLLRGDHQEARARLDQAAATGVRDAVIALMDGWLTAVEGDPEAAVRTLAPLLYSATTTQRYWPWWPGWARVLAMIGLTAGDERFVEAAVALAEEGAARNPGVASFEGLALQLRALVTADLELFSRATTTLRGSPRRMLQAGCAQDHGQLLVASGHRAEGIVELERAWDIYHDLRDRQSMTLVQNALRAVGVRRARWVREHPAQAWDTLTRAEIRVARLISEGHTNRTAAGALGLSANTVGTHLRSVFAKLGVTSRVQLTNVVNSRGEPNEMVATAKTVSRVDR